MTETIKEFKDELRALREEMFVNADAADIRLVASYVDRLVLALDKLSDALETMSVELETLSENEAVPASGNKTAVKKPKKARPAGEMSAGKNPAGKTSAGKSTGKKKTTAGKKKRR